MLFVRFEKTPFSDLPVYYLSAATIIFILVVHLDLHTHERMRYFVEREKHFVSVLLMFGLFG